MNAILEATQQAFEMFFLNELRNGNTNPWQKTCNTVFEKMVAGGCPEEMAEMTVWAAAQSVAVKLGHKELTQEIALKYA